MRPIEIEVNPNVTHISENSENYIRFSAYSGYEEYEKERTEYSYFTLEKIFGSRKAHFINRLIYWLSKCGRNINGLSGNWIYNPTHEWANQLNCSISTIKRLIKSLEEQGIIISKKVNAKKYNQTKWYSLNFNLLNNILNSQDTKDNTVKNKRTNRLVQNETIIISNNRNNYTNTSSNELKKKHSDYKEEEINFSNVLKERKAQKTKLTANETRLVEQMVDLWNKVFIYSLNPIKAYILKSNKKSLFDVLNNHFEGDLAYWQNYAKMVNSSQFLMGEKETKNNFKATFTWLIKPETIEKIMNNEYGVGDRELDINNISSNVEAQKEEIINTADKKITEYVKQKIEDEKEQKELENYIKKEEYIDDSDKYGIGIYVQNIGSYNLVNNPDNKGILKTIYETYIVKKYFRRSRFKIREQLREMVSKQMKGESILGSFNLLKNLKDSLNFNCIEKSNIDLLTYS
jgi:hypothetical protein